MPCCPPHANAPTIEDLASAILEMLAALPDGDAVRRAAELRIVYGLTAAEIAERMALADAGEARGLIGEARQRLSGVIPGRLAEAQGREAAALQQAAQVILTRLAPGVG